jgi:hypothetical protein
MNRPGVWLVCLLILVLGASGCGDSDKGKNHKKDIPVSGPPEQTAPKK